MRILHITTEFPPIIYGGLGVATAGLVRASAEAGLKVAVLLFGPTAGGSYDPFEPRAAGPSRAARSPYEERIFEVSWFQDDDSVTRVAANWHPDILHLHSFWLWHRANAIRERLHIPLVYTVHSLDRAEYEIGSGPPQ